MYQLCDKLSPVNCATVTDTVKVTPLIKPVTESGIVSSATGGIAINNVLSNDSTNGYPSTLINSTISQVGLWPSGITLNTSTGSVTVVPGTTPGTYPITYQLCDKLSPVSCATMLDTVRVTPSIVPVTENGTVPSTGGTAINNVLSNDYTNGHPSTTTNSTISQVGLWPSGITLNPSTGSVTVVPGTTPGNYPIVYQLCDKLSPVNCATVTDTVKVTPLIKPVTESGIVSSATGGIAINNVLSNDSTNGYPSTLINSTISQVGLWPSGITLNTSTGSVTVVPGTTPGTYPITYQLCDKLSPVSCATMLDTVRVTPSIVPVTENGTVPSTGGTAINNVLSNDYTNGHPSTTTNSTISQVGLWPSGITLNPSTGSVTVVPGTTPGNYPIVYQLCDKLSPVNCATMLDSVRVTPYVGPITGQDHVCVGSTITLSNITTGGVWASNNTAVATVNTSTGVVTGVTPGTTTINYTVTINSVSTTQTKVVTVYANPLVNAISGLSSLCENNTIVLGSSPAGGVWSSNNTAVATVNSSTGVVTAISAGVATISYAVTNVNGCMSTVIKNITVYANPVVGQIGGNPNVCVGKTTLLSNTASGGVWSSNNMSVAIINSSTGVVTGLSAGVAMISYSVTNSNNCNTTVTQVVNVYTSPLVSSILGVSSVCVNNVTILSSSPSGGVWSSSNTLVATVDVVTGHVLGIAAGTSVISYMVTNVNGCSTTVTQVVTVYANPIVSPILGTLSICVNCVRNLSNATSGGVWSSSNTSIATVNINGQVTGIAAGTTSISYTVTSSNGCSITESVLFTVYPNPIVSPITGNPVTCVGSTTQLTSSPAGGAWSSNNTSVATIDAVSGLVTGVFGGTALIGYTVSDVNGCITTVTQLVTVNVGPLVSPIMGTGNICVAQTTVLSNSTSGGIWTSSNTAVATINSSGVVTGLSAGSAIISYTVTGSNGCSTSSTKTVNVYAYPVVDPITGYSSVCSGGSIVLSSSPSGGVWSSNNAGIATVNSATGVVTGVSAGSAIISYTVTNANGCSTIVSRVVTVNGKPVVDPIAGNASICVGNTTTLSNTTPAGTWSSSNTGVATINNSGLVTAISAGTTTITYTIVDGNGCVGTATQVVTVYANPVLGSISGTSGVCVGKTTLLINGSSGGVWSSSNTAVATIHATTGQVTGIAAGTSTISYTVTSSHGCSTTVNYTVTVYSNPLVDPIAGKSSTCVGGSVTFSSNTVGGVWSSSDTSVAIINSNTGVLTGVSAGTVVISYTVTNGNGCSTTVTYNFTVKANPVVNPITGQFNVCIGSISTLSNSTSGGVWNSSNTAVATITSNGIVTAVSVGSTTISYMVTGSNGCSTTVTQVLTVYAYPIVSPITGNNNACVGSTTTLSSATAGGVWSSSNTLVATINATTGQVTGVSAGTATMSYTLSNAAGCSTSVTKDVTISANPIVAVITGNSNVCVGNTITLSNTTVGGVWSSSNTSVATINSTTGEVTAVSAGTVTMSYAVTNSNGCTTTVSKDITVNANPTVAAITGNNNVCVGNTTTLSSATAGGVWSSSNTSIATIHATTGQVTAIIAGTVTMSYSVSNANNCTTVVTKDITIHANPIVAIITGSSNVCVGSTISLSSATTGGVWSSSNTAIATINATTGQVTGVASGTVTISYTVTNANNCSTTVTKDVTVNANPTVAAITGNASACVGSNISLSNATAGGVWSSSNTAVATINNSGLVTAVSSGTATISYMVTNANGCTTTATKDITIHANPVVAAITGNSALCVGSTTILSSATTGGVWSSSNTSIATINATTGQVTGVSAGVATMSYSVTNSNNCTTVVTKDITVNANPTVAAITGNAGVCVGNTTTLSNVTVGGTWSSSNTAVATIDATTGELTAITAGTTTISYTVTNSNNCTTTVTKHITVYGNPVLSPIAGGAVVCVGANLALSNPTIGGVWSSSNTAVATISSTGQVTGVSSGTATITYTYTNSNGCSSSVSKVISVYDSPTVSPITMTCSCSGNICVGQSIILSSATVGGVWGCGNTNVATISSTGVVTAVAPGTAIVSYTVTNANGCSTTVTQIDNSTCISTSTNDYSFRPNRYLCRQYSNIKFIINNR